MSEIKTHSKLSASGAHRWFECPGSVALCDLIPPKPDSEFSTEGTNAHAFMEFLLKRSGVTGPAALPNARYYIGKEKECKLDFKISEEMADHVQAFVDRVLWQFHQLPGAELLVEKRFHLKHIHPDLFGTADVVLVQPFGKIYVIDFKYGAGIGVEVEENPQLLYYGLGASHGEDFSEIVLAIFQPRHDHEAGPWREWATSPEYMTKFAKTLKQKAIETQKPDAPFSEGEHCRFCNAAGVCPQLHKKAITAAQTDFASEKAKLPEVKTLTDEQISRVVQGKKLIQNWLDSVEEVAFLKLMSGQKIDGLKLVRGRGRREWNDEIVVKNYFGDKVMQTKMMTVAQAEKVLGKEAVSFYTVNVEGGFNVAGKDDKRKEVIPANEDFAKIEHVSPEDF